MSDDKIAQNGENNLDKIGETMLKPEPAGLTGAAAESSETALKETLEALAASKQQLDKYREEVLRSRAEVDNIQKRTARDVSNAHKYALERILSDLLPVQDSLEMGLAVSAQSADIASLREGVELTLKQFTDVLTRHGVKALNPIGEKFNPELHQAMTVQESKQAAPGTVLAVLQKGYQLNDRLVRPAMVIVAKAPEPPAVTTAQEDSGDGAVS